MDERSHARAVNLSLLDGHVLLIAILNAKVGKPCSRGKLTEFAALAVLPAYCQKTAFHDEASSRAATRTWRSSLGTLRLEDEFEPALHLGIDFWLRSGGGIFLDLLLEVLVLGEVPGIVFLAMQVPAFGAKLLERLVELQRRAQRRHQVLDPVSSS